LQLLPPRNAETGENRKCASIRRTDGKLKLVKLARRKKNCSAKSANQIQLKSHQIKINNRAKVERRTRIQKENYKKNIYIKTVKGGDEGKNEVQ